MAQKPTGFKISGGANASIRYYTATKNFDSRAPFMLQINAQPVFFYKNWRIPTRLALGNAQTSYRDFSRYGMTPENEKIRIFIGHNSPAWSPLVLQNRPILGLGFELKPGTLRLGLFAGRVQRAGLRDTFRNRVFAPQFTRNMAALQLGYGKQENQILLTFLMGSDNQNSLDSASKIGLPASNNGIFSLQATRSLGNLSAAAEASFSAFTQNKNLNTSVFLL
jgi:hypothetical protein